MIGLPMRRRRFLGSALATGAGVAATAALPGVLGLGAAPARAALSALPAREAGSLPSRVVVIGAGLAGLAAARELTRAGHRVVVLEARERPGGRVFTERSAFSLPVEQGAVVFSGSYSVANRYIDELGIGRLPFLAADLPTVYHVGGERRAVAAGDSLAGLYDLTDAEAAMGPIGLVLEYFVNRLPAEAMRPGAWPSDALKALEAQSFAGFLAAQGASPGAIRLIEDALYFGWDPENASALSIAMTDIGLFFQGAPMFVLQGGNGTLPEALAAGLGDAVVYGAEVTELQEGSSDVAVRYRVNGAEQVTAADHVVLALPAPVAAARAGALGLSARYRSALQALPQHDISRVQFEVDGAYWRAQGHAGAAVTDLFGGRVDQQPYSDAGDPSRPAVLDALIVGPDAAELAALDDDVLFATVAGELEKIHPGLASHRKASAARRWVSDPLTLGGWSWAGPGFLSAHFETLQLPQGRVHFAGEHTSLLRATMEGALESGVRAATEIEARVQQSAAG